MSSIAESLPQWFRNTKAGQEAIRQESLDLLNTRKKLVSQLADVRAKAQKTLPALDEKVAAVAVKVEAARAALQKVEAEAREAHAERWNASSSLDRQADQIRKQLRDSADPSIDDFRREVGDMLERVRRDGLSFATIDRWSHGERKAVQVHNGDSVRTCIEAMQAAGEAAEAMKLEPLSPEQVTARLEALRAKIPAVEAPALPAA